MSISKNVGSLARQLNTIRTNPGYYKFKDRIEKVILRIPFIGKWLRKTLFKSKTALKNAIYNTNIFIRMVIKDFYFLTQEQKTDFPVLHPAQQSGICH